MMLPAAPATPSPFQHDIHLALQRRGQRLVEAADVAEQTALLSPLEYYLIVKEIGVDDATVLLHHATPEQKQICCDLDCWEQDEFCATELDAWLAPYQAQGQDTLAATFFQLDHEVQTLFINASLQIYDLRSEPAPEPSADTRHKTTLDNFFELHTDLADRDVEPFALIDALYAYDTHQAFRLLMAAKWELFTETVEQAYQFRMGRLADLGFVEPEVAAKLFAPPPSVHPSATNLSRGLPQTRLPGLYAHTLSKAPNRLSRAMAQIRNPDVLAQLESQLVYLINAASVAYQRPAKSLGQLLLVANWVRDTLCLGLETHMRQDTGQNAQEDHVQDLAAAQLVQTIPLLHLFQLGQAQIKPLQKAAQRLSQDPVAAAWLNVHLHPDDDPEATDRAFLRALAHPRPLLCVRTHNGPLRLEAWQTHAQLETTQARLEALAARLL